MRHGGILCAGGKGQGGAKRQSTGRIYQQATRAYQRARGMRLGVQQLTLRDAGQA
jgi:hypothetical protein